MKHAILALALTLWSSTVDAGHIGVYADPTGRDCNLEHLLPYPNANVVYVVHTVNGGATGAVLKIQDTSALFPITQSSPYETVGDWFINISVAYGGCVVGDHVIGVLNYFWFGGPPPTCDRRIEVFPAPLSPVPGSVVVTDCAVPPNYGPATGGSLTVGSAEYACYSCGTVPTRASSWGAVKALYR